MFWDSDDIETFACLILFFHSAELLMIGSEDNAFFDIVTVSFLKPFWDRDQKNAFS